MTARRMLPEAAVQALRRGNYPCDRAGVGHHLRTASFSTSLALVHALQRERSGEGFAGCRSSMICAA